MKKPILFTIILAFILASLIYNLIDTKLKLDNYYKVSNIIHNIALKNKDFDNYINSTFSYSNFDQIEGLVKQMEYEMNNLQSFSKIYYKEERIKNALLSVKDSIKNKILILEKVEAYRAILNNSFRLIQKIHEKIDNKELTEFYTLIMTIDKNKEIDLKAKQNIIQHIKPNNTFEEYFVKHTNTILNYYFLYSNLNKESNNLQTNKYIANYIKVYEKYSLGIIKDAQISIIIVFAILIILIAINLTSSFKTIKNNQELIRFKSAVENSDNIIMVTDTEHKINYVNDAFLETTGYKKKEILGKTPAVLKSGKLPKEHYENLNKTISQGKIWNGEFINFNKVGDLRYEKASIIPIFDDKNNIIEYMAIKLDITEDIKKNQQLKEKDEMLAQQSKMAAMGEMLENIAHQWRQPLSAISSNSTSLILQKSAGIPLSDEEMLKTLNAINDSSQYLSETINSFRDFFKTNKETKIFNLKDSSTRALNFIESKLRNQGIKLVKNLNDTYINGVESELIQVIMNFYTNAIDILEEKDQDKYLLIDVYQEDNHSIIKITDSGGGVPKEIISRVFEPYFTTKHKAQGTGIGLYMSREIIVKHLNGDIFVNNIEFSVDNKKLKGAEFIVKIPTAKGEEV